MQPLEVERQIEVVEQAVKTTNSEVGIKPLVVIQVETIETIVEQPKAQKVAQCFHLFFQSFYKYFENEI